MNLIGPYDRIAQLAEGAKENKFLQTVKPLSDSSLEQATQTWGEMGIQNPIVSMVEHDGWYGDDKWCLAMQFDPWSHLWHTVSSARKVWVYSHILWTLVAVIMAAHTKMANY